MPADAEEQQRRRTRMVERDIAGRGIHDPRVIEAMGAVPREAFLPETLAAFAYDDNPLPIDDGQTISQPYIVAAMAEAAELEPGDRVLEIGTGSGYGAAIIGRLAAQVWSVERHRRLAETATERLAAVGADNVRVVHGDGTLGLPEEAPFDAIVVTAAAPRIPEALINQLVDGGRLVVPVGPARLGQRLVRIRRTDDGIIEDDLGGVRFVPLVPGTAARGGAPRPDPT